MWLFYQKTYPFLWLFRFWWGTQQSLDLPQYLIDCSLMNIKPRSQFFFQLGKFTCQTPLFNKHLSHTDERADYKYAHLNCTVAA